MISGHGVGNGDVIPIVDGALSALPPRLSWRTGVPEVCVAYVVFRAGQERPLYVGISIDPGSRLLAHARRSHWWPKGGHVLFLHPPHVDRVYREVFEQDVITDLDPVHNKIRPRRYPRIPDEVAADVRQAYDGCRYTGAQPLAARPFIAACDALRDAGYSAGSIGQAVGGKAERAIFSRQIARGWTRDTIDDWLKTRETP